LAATAFHGSGPAPGGPPISKGTDMAVKVAINGFGRIGRNVLRAIIESGRTDIEVVAINDLGPVETNAHLLRFDSVHGRFPGQVKTTEDSIDVGRGPIRVTAIRNPAELPWSDVDVALECTGIFTDRDKAAIHLENGSKRVLVSAPSKGADKTIVYGVNHDVLTADDWSSPTPPAPPTASRPWPRCCTTPSASSAAS
jgi:glyceraldehyde 3-phosphate dehydrogenase